jgi:hypothetical protein
MSASNTQSVPQEQFLTMAVNLLHKGLIENSRTQAKNVYKEIVAGKTVALTNVRMENDSVTRFDLALDHSEYRGGLNFGAFRASLTMLISSLGESLHEKKAITTFSAHDDSNMMIFGVTGVTKEAEDPNVMVLGAEMSADRPTVLLKLMYLDHKQFAVDPEEPA